MAGMFMTALRILYLLTRDTLLSSNMLMIRYNPHGASKFLLNAQGVWQPTLLPNCFDGLAPFEWARSGFSIRSSSNIPGPSPPVFDLALRPEQFSGSSSDDYFDPTQPRHDRPNFVEYHIAAIYSRLEEFSDTQKQNSRRQDEITFLLAFMFILHLFSVHLAPSAPSAPSATPPGRSQIRRFLSAFRIWLCRVTRRPGKDNGANSDSDEEEENEGAAQATDTSQATEAPQVVDTPPRDSAQAASGPCTCTVCLRDAARREEAPESSSSRGPGEVEVRRFRGVDDAGASRRQGAGPSGSVAIDERVGQGSRGESSTAAGGSETGRRSIDTSLVPRSGGSSEAGWASSIASEAHVVPVLWFDDDDVDFWDEDSDSEEEAAITPEDYVSARILLNLYTVPQRR
ncbi:hypothetical protein DXG01_001392 [Tephrocybe rancida]|nr:hypothetical protein DXG01_001392 [Tephrocybe rancida]